MNKDRFINASATNKKQKAIRNKSIKCIGEKNEKTIRNKISRNRIESSLGIRISRSTGELVMLNDNE
jgi:hypothetical protein